MSRLASSFVLGYHGCDRQLGERLLGGVEPLQLSFEQYHWLGAGLYFWEIDPLRALEWAQSKKARNACDVPFVFGAIIDLGNCLDLQARENVGLVKDAYESFVKTRDKAGGPLPTNRKARNDSSPDLVLRYLDCAVIDHLHAASEAAGDPFDTVRGVFPEGEPIFPGSKMLAKCHSQIAVRNLDCIKGLFRLPEAFNDASIYPLPTSAAATS